MLVWIRGNGGLVYVCIFVVGYEARPPWRGVDADGWYLLVVGRGGRAEAAGIVFGRRREVRMWVDWWVVMI
jgi:hypothetical protein